MPDRVYARNGVYWEYMVCDGYGWLCIGICRYGTGHLYSVADGI